jgi:hypothetical protein
VPAPGRSQRRRGTSLKGRTFTSSSQPQSSQGIHGRTATSGKKVGHDRPAMRHFGQNREREELPTREEAARYLRVTRRTLDRTPANGIGPAAARCPWVGDGPGGLHRRPSGSGNAMRRPPLELCPWLTRLLEVEALVPASHAPPVMQEWPQVWRPPCRPGTGESSQTRRRPMDAPGMHHAAPARMLRGCLSETLQVRGGAPPGTRTPNPLIKRRRNYLLYCAPQCR